MEMRRVSKKSRMIFIALILFAVCIILIPQMLRIYYKNRIKVSDATVGYFYSNMGRFMIPVENGNFFIIDTGCESSYIFNDRLKIKPKILGRNYLINLKEKRVLLSQRIDTFQIGNMLINNNDFILIKSEKTTYKNDTNIVGQIGMDILSQKYCYFDMKNQTITFSDKKITQTEPPFFEFFYELPNVPEADININGNIFEDVLFDTGLNSFLGLLECDRGKLNAQSFLEESTAYGFFGNQYSISWEQFDSLTVEGISFSPPVVSYGHKRRLLGMSFATSWSSFLIDPFEKKIEFYL